MFLANIKPRGMRATKKRKKLLPFKMVNMNVQGRDFKYLLFSVEGNSQTFVILFIFTLFIRLIIIFKRTVLLRFAST